MLSPARDRHASKCFAAAVAITMVTMRRLRRHTESGRPDARFEQSRARSQGRRGRAGAGSRSPGNSTLSRRGHSGKRRIHQPAGRTLRRKCRRRDGGAQCEAGAHPKSGARPAAAGSALVPAERRRRAARGCRVCAAGARQKPRYRRRGTVAPDDTMACGLSGGDTNPPPLRAGLPGTDAGARFRDALALGSTRVGVGAQSERHVRAVEPDVELRGIAGALRSSVVRREPGVMLRRADASASIGSQPLESCAAGLPAL